MDLRLPNLIASRQDITKVNRELRIFLDMVTQSVLRHDNPIQYPAISAYLRALATDNQIDLRDEKACQELLNKLEILKLKSPTVRISFPAEPDQVVLQKLVAWFRKEIDPKIVIQVGLQPTIAAGIVLRTPNHQFDFSLRQRLYKETDKLKEALTGGR